MDTPPAEAVVEAGESAGLDASAAETAACFSKIGVVVAAVASVVGVDMI